MPLYAVCPVCCVLCMREVCVVVVAPVITNFSSAHWENFHNENMALYSKREEQRRVLQKSGQSMSSSGTVISRKDLYEDSEVSDTDEVVLPKIDFEFVETKVEEKAQDEPMQEEFDFPLFSFGSDNSNDTSKTVEERGRTLEKSSLVKVSLRSPSPVRIKQERPMSYYVAHYTAKQRDEFTEAAITWEQLVPLSKIRVNNPFDKVIDLVKFNSRVERDLNSLKAKKTRPGKKARLARLESKKGIKKRKDYQKKLDEEAHRKLMKKMNHKRGGKKHKKKQGNAQQKPQQPTKPKYRTE